MKKSKIYNLFFAATFTLLLPACDERGNSNTSGDDKKVNISDSRRNTTDTANYTVDSTAKRTTQ